MKVYRVYFESKAPNSEVCCVLVAARTKEQARVLAVEQVKCFPGLDLGTANVMEFDISKEHASIC